MRVQAKSDECAVAVCGSIAVHGNSLEALQLADRLLDPGAGLVELIWEETGPVVGVLAVRNDRSNATAAASCAIGS
jgi:hypothetical protein